MNASTVPPALSGKDGAISDPRLEPAVPGRFGRDGLPKRSIAKLGELVFGRRVEAALSERVRRRIEQQQAASEIIIGWIQACAVVFFAVIYATSPKAFPPGTRFEPVPWTLSIYAMFTTARIVLAYRGRLSRGFLTLSVVVDIGVLMITIWSFHLQYGAPPALYLKAPTLMYVFILIALRTLRFEPRYVLLAGGCAAAGWLALFVYAAEGLGGAAPAFTHNYVDYVTSYKILGGAEIDKILSILMVTAILALSLSRARRLLVASVAEEFTVSDLSRFFAPEVAKQIRGSETVVTHCGGCEAAVLMTDLRGFTDLSGTVSAEALIALLAEYQSRLVPVIQHHGGSIDKYLGDGILASFGAVAPNPYYAADLCRALDALAATARAWRLERQQKGLPAPNVGMAGGVGDVVFGRVGHESRLEYTVIGEVVNLVAKLEKHTKTERAQALTTRTSYARALEQGYRPTRAVEERLGRSIEGVTHPVDLVVLAQ